MLRREVQLNRKRTSKQTNKIPKENILGLTNEKNKIKFKR